MVWKKMAFNSDLTAHTGSASNPHSVTATQVGLGNCNNTSDANKPISTATQTALDTLASYIPYVNVLDFGALGNGAQDDTTYIQAAINSLSSTGGTVYLPPGTYRTTAALTLNTNGVTLLGAGRQATIIQGSAAAINIIVIGNYSTLTKNNRVSNLQITSSVVKTAGAAILVRNGHQTDIDRVTLMSNMYYGFQFEGGSSQYIYHLSEFEINSGLNGIIVGHEYASYSGSICQGLVCRDGDIANVTGVAIKLEHISGGFFRNVDVISSYEGVGMLPPTGCAVQACWFDTVLGDTCTNNGWEMTPSGTGFVKEIMLVSCWASSNTNYGILIDSSAGAGLISGVTLTGCRLTGNYKTGLYITAGVKAISISNLHCIGNSRSGSGSYHGVYLATGVDGVNFNGGVCGAGGLYTNYQSYGIYFEGTATNCSIVGVNVSGNITGGIRDTGITAGNTLMIESCIGHKTRNSGSCTITAGNTTVVVSHGLASTPAIAEISLAHSLNPNLCSAGGYQAWVTNVTSTTFTVNVSEAITSQTWLYWKVKTR